MELAVAADIEPLIEDQPRCGCRSLRTESAALDRRDDHDRLAARRRRSRRTTTGRGSAGARRCRSCRTACRGTSGSRRTRPPTCRPSAVAAPCRPAHDRVAVAGAEVHAPADRRADLLDQPAAAVLDLQAEVRADDLAVVDDRRVRLGELQRRRLEVALADREVDVVARRPRALDAAALVQRLGRALAGPSPSSRTSGTRRSPCCATRGPGSGRRTRRGCRCRSCGRRRAAGPTPAAPAPSR